MRELLSKMLVFMRDDRIQWPLIYSHPSMKVVHIELEKLNEEVIKKIFG